jgi:hypothetical protein
MEYAGSGNRNLSFRSWLASFRFRNSAGIAARCANALQNRFEIDKPFPENRAIPGTSCSRGCFPGQSHSQRPSYI